MAVKKGSSDPNSKANSNGDSMVDGKKHKNSGVFSETSPKNGKNPSSPNRGGSKNTAATTTTSNTNKVTAQLQKMRDANAKYKNLLKMAKERIEQQEIEIREMRGEFIDPGISF